MNWKPVEHRHHPRFASLNLVEFVHLDGNGNPDYEDVGRTVDLSEGGILLECARSFEHNSMFELQIAIHNNIFKAVGKAVHIAPVPGADKFDLGIEFTDISDRDRQHINYFLEADA